VHGDGEETVAVGVFGFDLRFKRDHGQGVEVSEIVGVAGFAAPIEIGGDEFVLRAAQFEFQKVP